MTMSTTGTGSVGSGRVRWSWLWSTRQDFVFNLLPFWLGYVLLAALFLTRNSGTGVDPHWMASLGGRSFDIMVIAAMLYGPLIDGPHLWATIARTYTDTKEWAARRTLFLTSLLAFIVGPVVILIPYLINMVVPLPRPVLDWGWIAWTLGFSLCVIHHINQQHWGFVSLYKRKNGESDPRERRIDQAYFLTALWSPYVAMMTAPWSDPQHAGTGVSLASTFVFNTCHVVFLAATAAYLFHQVQLWRRGDTLNGPKLLYIATIVPLYYLTFSLDPRLAAFWVFITGTGHCAQYHGVVWAYGEKRYASAETDKRSLPQMIFSNAWVYIVLGVVFALVTLQGPGAYKVEHVVGAWLENSVFASVFSFLDPQKGNWLGVQLIAAMISGVRLHHFYVDSKIWKVSKNKTLAKDLNVAA
ncbi:MAG: hypothetical protein QM773_10060 [Hyphomonadaceae bacterium]